MNAPRFRCGMVVGKFAPLHKGHALVIDAALAQCAQVILVSYSNPELPGCEPAAREAWLEACYPNARRLVVTDRRLAQWLEPETGIRVPANSAPDEVHRDFVALLCRRVLGVQVEAVFSSEAYGEGFAQRLTQRLREYSPGAPAVVHVSVDPHRRHVPVSGTKIRQDLFGNWEYLPPPVARSLARRVVLLGGESSGKSALAARLARVLETQCVAEYGRELWQARQGVLEFADMVRIAREQVAREECALALARGFVFCDTSPLTTLFYSLDLFGAADPELVQLSGRPYELVVLCAPDFPFCQDGTRRDGAFRLRQHAWYQATLAQRGVPYLLAAGSIEQRVACVQRALSVRSAPAHAGGSQPRPAAVTVGVP